MVMHNQPLLDSLSAAMRIKQILGLPPQADYGYIVQFWVPVSQLVRPTPDPDVHNHFSTVKFPQQVDPGHKQWIEHLRSTTYTSDPPYPWTQLGYTYDWGNPYSSVGVSEFVIKPGAAIRIEHLALVHTASRLDGRGHTDKLSSIFTHNIPKIPGFVQGTCRFTTENS